MVYNAMKLFMEVNPQLFDECTHEYTETQSNADAVKADRQAKWDRLAQLAERMKAGNAAAPAVRPPQSNSTAGSGYNGGGSRPSSKSATPLKQDSDGELLSRESQQRMERLRLQDDRERERRPPKEVERLSNAVR
jgi:serine/threonine-protein phosphatase 2A regulatory subunit B'